MSARDLGILSEPAGSVKGFEGAVEWSGASDQPPVIQSAAIGLSKKLTTLLAITESDLAEGVYFVPGPKNWYTVGRQCGPDAGPALPVREDARAMS